MARRTAIERWTTDYVQDFISDDEERLALVFMQSLRLHHYRSRGVVLKRGMCEFGVSYPPTGKIGAADPIPTELAWLSERVAAYCEANFDQLIVTWYPPGAGIGIHADHPQWFGDPIAAVSLGGSGVLRGRHELLGSRDQIVAPRSLYVLHAAERYQWRHELRPVRSERWSLTFRVLTPAARSVII